MVLKLDAHSILEFNTKYQIKKLSKLCLLAGLFWKPLHNPPPFFHLNRWFPGLKAHMPSHTIHNSSPF